ncbi:ADP-ribosylglycohydrolase family protein [Bacillus sp. 1P06AnD]|uniref:ADP-ribosylglycohydrolase family protein n=1 Tax=Bacillus sp. 1P06AnD TaxID=3132208 RepID=UPI0039A0AAA0
MKNKMAGALYGMALGDAMGMPSELWGRNRVRNYFGKIECFLDGPKENEVACNYTRGQFTDDTGQALVILDSLMATGFKPVPAHIAEKLLEWADKENAFENNILGPTSKVALQSFRENKDAKTFTDQALSNGSAMRIAPIGCLFHPEEKEKLANYVYDVSQVTHTSDITIAGAAMIAMAVSSAIVNADFQTVLEDAYAIEPIARILGAETYSPSLTARTRLGIQLADEHKGNDVDFLDSIYDLIGAGVNISESVPAALAIAYYAQDANSCSLLCANLAGDTDTIGAMATAVCGAFTGVDKIREDYIEVLEKENDTDFGLYIDSLMGARG